jgi:anti-sigma regulatory factor (Ser/Thr protein kinase)
VDAWWVFEPKPENVSAVRLFAAEWLGKARRSAPEVVLAASELATNAVEHARTAFVVRLKEGDHVCRVEVSDGCEANPVLAMRQPDRPGGRGLLIVDRLSTRWGVEIAPNGKTVWAEFDC